MARDLIHEPVKTALQRDGWAITQDPLRIDLEEKIGYYEIDLGAEQVIAAERRGRKIAVEIKSFLGESLLNQFHEVLGQYLNYRSALTDMRTDREMYLAISTKVYKAMTQMPFILRRLEEFSVKLIIVQLEDETITQWID